MFEMWIGTMHITRIPRHAAQYTWKPHIWIDPDVIARIPPQEDDG